MENEINRRDVIVRARFLVQYLELELSKIEQECGVYVDLRVGTYTTEELGRQINRHIRTIRIEGIHILEPPKTKLIIKEGE